MRGDARSGKLRTLVFHVQLCSFLSRTLNVEFPPRIATFFNGSESVSGFRLDALGCVFQNYDQFVTPVFLAAGLPLFSVLLAMVVTAAFQVMSVFVCRSRGEELHQEGQSLFQPERYMKQVRVFAHRFVLLSVFYWLFLLYGAFSSLSSVLACTDFGSDGGGSFVSSALWVACSGDRYFRLRRTAVALIVLFSLLTMAIFAISEAGRREALKGHHIPRAIEPPTSDSRENDTRTTPYEPDSEALFSHDGRHRMSATIAVYLGGPYRTAAGYWDGVATLRRLLLSVFTNVLPFDSVLRPVAATLVLALSVLIQGWVKPFKSSEDNAFEGVSLSVLLVTFVAGVLTHTEGGGGTSYAAGLFIIIVNGSFVAIMLIRIVQLTATAAARQVKRLARTKDAARQEQQKPSVLAKERNTRRKRDKKQARLLDDF